MAASIDDLALAYRIMATPPPASEDSLASSFPAPLPNPSTASPKNKTIGIFRDWIDRAEPPVRAIFDKTLAYYRQQNYTIIDISIPYLPEGQRAHVLTIMAEIASGLNPSQIRSLSAPNRVLVSMGMWQIHAQEYLAAQRLRSLLMSHLAHLFRAHPGLLILSPSTPIPGWKISGGAADLAHGLSDGKSSVRNMEYVWLANFTGCPAINCPAGYVRDVPVGVMAMGEWGVEEDLIAFARDGEGVLDVENGGVQDKKGKGDGGSESEGEGAKGLKIPSGEKALWEDVIAEARGRRNS